MLSVRWPLHPLIWMMDIRYKILNEFTNYRAGQRMIKDEEQDYYLGGMIINLFIEVLIDAAESCLFQFRPGIRAINGCTLLAKHRGKSECSTVWICYTKGSLQTN